MFFASHSQQCNFITMGPSLPRERDSESDYPNEHTEMNGRGAALSPWLDLCQKPERLSQDLHHRKHSRSASTRLLDAVPESRPAQSYADKVLLQGRSAAPHTRSLYTSLYIRKRALYDTGHTRSILKRHMGNVTQMDFLTLFLNLTLVPRVALVDGSRLNNAWVHNRSRLSPAPLAQPPYFRRRF